MKTNAVCSRREFVQRAALAASAAAAGLSRAAEPFAPKVVVFSKIYQQLKLDFAAAADLTAEAGLDGVDCPVRPGGEIPPEQAADRLPLYLEALQRRRLDMPYLTTGIQSPATPHTETVLRTAQKLGIGIYRMGFRPVDPAVSREKQAAEVRAQLRDVAAMSKDLGLCAVFQNHSPAGKHDYIGGDLAELRRLMDGLDPAHMAVAFDFAHAVIVHGDDWRKQFDALRPWIKTAYVKDADRVKKFVPFGEGEYAKSGYFTLLKKMNYARPFSMHIEYDWSGGGKHRDRATLLKTLQASLRFIRRWCAEA